MVSGSDVGVCSPCERFAFTEPELWSLVALKPMLKQLMCFDTSVTKMQAESKQGPTEDFRKSDTAEMGGGSREKRTEDH